MPPYKLTYFRARGRAEVSRYMFFMKGVEFEDNRVEGDGWKALKPNTPFGSLPVLEVDGVMICQSAAIERLLAKRFDLYGKDPLEQAKADMIVGCTEDFIQALWKSSEGANDEEKAKSKKSFEEEKLKTMLCNMEKMVSPAGFFLGKDMMWPDISFSHILTFLDAMGISYDLGPYPKINNIKSKVEGETRIARWIKKRPDSKF